MEQYNPIKIEDKWRKRWQSENRWQVDIENAENPYFNLMMFPYPSAEGLHVGNLYAFVGSDIHGRYMRMRGYDVFEPIGFDAFGIHSENFAIKKGMHPRELIKESTSNFRSQLEKTGNIYSWDQEVNTTHPKYYKWTQWLFLQLHKAGLAYLKEAPVQWCPSCKTVLANEQVIAGKCERCDSIVEAKQLKQWFFKITEYADRLLENLAKIDWSERTKTAQANWIGKSTGYTIQFPVNVPQGTYYISVFTTRPDTLFGATYMVLAPEHDLVTQLKDNVENWNEVSEYIEAAKAKSQEERIEEKQDTSTDSAGSTSSPQASSAQGKTGVELQGIKAKNPANNEDIPVWVADYVLAEYGTGAIMAVPAHDERDYEFAKSFDLPVKTVIEPVTGTPQKDPEFRKSIVALVKDPKSNKILSLNWGDLGGNLLIGGGIEEGEDLVECAKREVEEETGYSNLKLIDTSETIHHSYFARAKNKARQIEAIGVYFELQGDERKEVQHEEHEKDKFTVEWVDAEELEPKIKDELHRYVFEKFVKDKVYTGEGILVNSGDFDGMKSEEAKDKIGEYVEGDPEAHYHLRDWLISRQRYWGPPIPIIYCRKCWETLNSKSLPDRQAGEIQNNPKKQNELEEGVDYTIIDGEEYAIVPAPEEDLPVELPHLEDYQPTGTGKSPLAKSEGFVHVKCPECGGEAHRETDVSDTFLDSCWYFLRYPSRDVEDAPWKEERTQKWLPVDMYIGGQEHAVLHLMYARFITMFLYDEGRLHFEEPFKKFRAHGLLIREGAKISKSRGNIINPDEFFDSYGVDTVRTYLMFLSPFQEGGDWRDEGVRGVHRFLGRVWKVVHGEKETDGESGKGNNLESVKHKTIKKVTEDIERLHYNTAIASLMSYLNELEAAEHTNEHTKTLLVLLAPFAPYMTEELWERMEFDGSVHDQKWPEYKEELIKEDTVTIPVQINGKVKGEIKTSPGTGKEELEKLALSEVEDKLEGKEPSKVVVVPDKIVNIVVSNQ